MIIAVDFDGTLTKEMDFPEIGEPRLWLIEKIKRLQQQNHKLILWTCREDIYEGERASFPPRLYLTEALGWCEKYGLRFDAVNKNYLESKDPNFIVCRKIFADMYIDDKSSMFDDTTNQILYNDSRSNITPLII